MFEVRDEEDAEIKQYTHDKDIVEILVEKENYISVMETKIYKIMSRALAFLKEVNIFNYSMQPKYLNRMQLLNIQEEFRKNIQRYNPSMISLVYERIGCLMSMTHAKKLLLTHGLESFNDYVSNYFDTTKKDKKNVNFLKQLKETEEYAEL